MNKFLTKLHKNIINNHNKNIGVIIQSRMTSTRLPGKVLQPVYQTDSSSLSMLEAIINRINNSNLISSIIIATTTNITDNPIIDLCHEINQKNKEKEVKVFRGSENNVLERYYLAAKEHNLDIVIRITSDCPVIDVNIMNDILSFFLINKYDYVSNTLERTYPRGLDIEIFSFFALELAYKNATTEIEKEHVTPYIYGHNKEFKLFSYIQPIDWSEFRLTVDTDIDMELIRKIYSSLYPSNPNFTQKDIINLLLAHSDWAISNHDISQKLCSQEYYLKHSIAP